MKQFSKIALIMVITTVFVFLTACGGGSDSKDGGNAIEGKWTVSDVEVMGESFTVSELEEAAAMMGVDFSMVTSMTYEFKSGDVVTLSAFGQSVDGTYAVDGNTVTVDFEGETQEMQLDGGKLAIDEPSTGARVYLSK